MNHQSIMGGYLRKKISMTSCCKNIAIRDIVLVLVRKNSRSEVEIEFLFMVGQQKTETKPLRPMNVVQLQLLSRQRNK